jgi:hypothetical protein
MGNAMAGFFKFLFGTGEPERGVRRLSHPRDLRQGDIIKFRYVEQPDISNKEFEVTQINTYIYGDLCYPELVLKDRSGHLIYMMVEEEDGDEYLALSKKIQKSEIAEIIGADAMGRIATKGTGARISIQSKPEELETWLADSYREVDDNVKGAFVKGDARYLSVEDINRQEKFTSHILEDPTEEYAIEIEIYNTGEIESCVTVYHEIDEIEEMWPSSTPLEGGNQE